MANRITEKMKFHDSKSSHDMTSLDERHWMQEDYVQRMLLKDWRGILLNHRDKIVMQGNVRTLQAKSIGTGVYEVSKAPL